MFQPARGGGKAVSIENVPPLGSIPGGGNVKLPAQPDKRCHWRLRVWPIVSDGRLTATRYRRCHHELSI